MADSVPVPRFVHVAHLVRRGIDTGVYPVGGPLPPLERLAETYGVPPGVVRAALRELRLEGLVSAPSLGGVTVLDLPGGASSTCLDG